MFRKLPYIICSLLIYPTGMFGQVMTVAEVEWNSEFNEFGACIYGEEIVYCSDRPSQFGVKRVDEFGRQPVKLYRTGTKEGKKNQYLQPSFNTHYNEGPVCFNATLDEIFYTGTIPTSSKQTKTVLGIYTSKKVDNIWTKPELLPFNNENGSFSTAHPMLSKDGKTLYLSSDMPGSKGGWDIYYCSLSDQGWSDPINIGNQINTEANECFPFQDDFSNLFFTSDRNPSQGMDIYECKFNKDHYIDPIPLSEPVNTALDDFAYVSTNGGELGYFSSNRNGSDDIFKFEYAYPTFEACPPAEQPTFCYYFEETSIVPNDSMKFVYEWELGDGSISAGLSTEHCYKDFGHYHIALNVYDSLTRVKFARVSELDLEIMKSPFPWISSPDSVSQKTETSLSAVGTDIPEFDCREYYWDFGDGRHSRGFNTTHLFPADGMYQVQLGIIGLNTQTGQEEKRCATKTIVVGLPENFIDFQKDSLINSMIQKDMVFMPDDSAATLMYVPDSTLYYIQFHESEKQLSLDDPYFNNIKYEITERFQEDETKYKYSVGNTSDVNVMFRIYNDLVDKGYAESIIRETKTDEFAYATTKKWWYFADSLASAINTHLNKFNDIQFSKDDYKIRPASFDNLDYIAQVLNMEPELKLKIMAHTDSIGTAEHNMKLSTQRAMEVVNYFVNKGIDSNRLLGIGFGEEAPIASNSNEQGRSENRRVSFEIILAEKPKR
jgi:outer membrane protein OmpA-like peptidoglycan-associated protein